MALEIKIDVSRLEQLANIIKNTAIVNIEEDIATELSRDLKRTSPIKSGKSANGWNFKKVGAQIVVENSVPHTLFLINGTRPHDIFPKNKSVLAFKMNGRMIYAKHVKHPGTKPNDFVDKSIARIEGDINSIVNKILKESGVIE